MKLITLFAILPLAILAGCSTTPDDEPRGIKAYEGDARLGEQTNRICFGRTIDGFSNMRRDSVVLSSGSQDYLVTVSGTCRSLRFAQAIGVDNRGAGCVSRNDILIVSENAFGNDVTGIGPDRCFIDDIYTWDKRANSKKLSSEKTDDVY